MATWPSDDLGSGSNLDQDTDNPLLARPTLYAMLLKIKAMLATVPAGSTPLTASGLQSALLAAPVIDNATGIGQGQTFIAGADETNTTSTLGASTYLQTNLVAGKWYRWRLFAPVTAAAAYEVSVVTQNAASSMSDVARSLDQPTTLNGQVSTASGTTVGYQSHNQTSDIVQMEGVFKASASGGWVAVEYAAPSGASCTLKAGSFFELTQLN